MRIPIRHGEVLLLPVNSTPVGSSERVTRCVVGESESGHDPVLDGDREFARIVDAKGTLYVDLDERTRLWYQKDRDQRGERELEVAAGVWRVVRRTAPEVPEVQAS
ncbi:MAG: hypothetical protein QOK12_3761 [Mycobacterium sp.]|jgi:hypothetical protein|nr:hypothetical protein [Mycobacterium sp.]